MLAVLFLLTSAWLGFVLDDRLKLSRGDGLVRLAAGFVIGIFTGTWLVFALSLALGFTTTAVGLGVALLAGAGAFAAIGLKRDLTWLSTRMTFDRGFWLAAALPTVLLTLFIANCIGYNAGGDIVFRGNSRDFAYHLGTVTAFLEQSQFPPQNPQAAGTQLSYHFMSNFFAAILCRGGFSPFYSIKLPMVLLAFSLCALTCNFFYSLLRSKAATFFAGGMFFFGHVGLVNLAFGLAGYPSGNTPLSLLKWASVEDHITYPYYNFLNVVIDYFQPQLPFIFAFPIATLLLLALVRSLTQEDTDRAPLLFTLGAVGLMPLVHMHTFLVLGPVAALAALRALFTPAASDGAQRFAHRGWLLVGGVIAVAAAGLQLAFILSQPKVAGFSGFDVGQFLRNLSDLPTTFGFQRPWFWFRVAGATMVPGALGLLCVLMRLRQKPAAERRVEYALLPILAICTGYFLLINFYRFTPNWGDSNKFFLYLNLLCCLYAGRLLAAGWARSRGWRIAAGFTLGFCALVPTAVEAVSRFIREPERLFSGGDQLVADWIRLNTPHDAIFLSANSYVHPVTSLAGRRVVNGSYTRETGYAGPELEALVAQAYRNADPSRITRVNVTHVIAGPEEDYLYYINRAKWGIRHRLLFDQMCQGYRYTIYEVRHPTPTELAREAAVEAARKYVWLSELEPESVHQPYGTLKFDKTFNLQAIKLAGVTYPSGLGTHAPSKIRYRLNGENYTRFEAIAGLDDSQMESQGSITFEVWVDDQLRYTSPIKRSGQPPEHVSIDLKGASTLRLVTTTANDGDHSDHADWAAARLFRQPTVIPEASSKDGANAPEPPQSGEYLADVGAAPHSGALATAPPAPLQPTFPFTINPNAMPISSLGWVGLGSFGLACLGVLFLWSRSRDATAAPSLTGSAPNSTSLFTRINEARLAAVNTPRGRAISRGYPWLLAVIFMGLAAFGALHHEMWRDEMQAWLIARDLDGIKALLQQAKYEATPPLWSPMLAALAHFTDRPEAMQVLTWFLAVFTFLVFCLRAPLNVFQKALLTCNYYLVYQYGTVCRNYLLGVLGVALACAFLLAPKPRPLLGALCLVAAAFASIHSFILAIALATAFWVAPFIFGVAPLSRKWFQINNSPKDLRTASVCLVIFGAGAALALYLVSPAPDGLYSPASQWRTHWDPEHLGRVCWAFVSSTFVWPRPPSYFWIPPWDTPFRSYEDNFAYACAALLWLASILFFIRSPRALAAYLVGTVGVATFLYTKYLGFIRHTGFLFFAFICAYWIFLASATPAEKKNRPWRFHVPSLMLTAMLITQAITGLWALKEDYNHPFSGGKDAAKYLKKNNLADHFIAVGPDWAGAPIAGYLNRKLYYPYAGRMGSFIRWDTHRLEKMPDEDFYLNARAAAPAGPFIIVLDHELDADLMKKYNIEMRAYIRGSMTPFEEYVIYYCH
jgi:hypothetical protein